MLNLRQLVDGVGNLQINAKTVQKQEGFKARDEVVIRRNVNKSGPATSEVLVGTILAMNADNTAKVSVRKGNGLSEQMTVPVEKLQPVTESFKRTSMQYNTAFRGGW